MSEYVAYPVIGARDFVTAKLTADTQEKLTYDAVKKVPGLIGIEIEDVSGTSEAKYADDAEQLRINKSAKLRVIIELLATDEKTLADFYGHTYENGVIVKKEGDQAPYRALGFKAEDAANGDEVCWLKKAVPTKRTPQKSYHTKEGENVTVQTVKIELECIATIKDKEYQRLGNTRNAEFTESAQFFAKVPGATA